MEQTTTEEKPLSLSEAKRLQAQEYIAEGIARGLTITEACHTSDVSRQTFYNWLDTDEAFRRHISYAEEEASSILEASLHKCADKAEEDPRYQRSLIYLLQHRERRRERQADRELRAELFRLKQEHEFRLLQAQAGVPAAAPTPSPDPTPHSSLVTLTTPVRRGANIPMHLRPTRHLYRAAPGPLRSSAPLPTQSANAHSSPPDTLWVNLQPRF